MLGKISVKKIPKPIIYKIALKKFISPSSFLRSLFSVINNKNKIPNIIYINNIYPPQNIKFFIRPVYPQTIKWANEVATPSLYKGYGTQSFPNFC